MQIFSSGTFENLLTSNDSCLQKYNVSQSNSVKISCEVIHAEYILLNLCILKSMQPYEYNLKYTIQVLSELDYILDLFVYKYSILKIYIYIYIYI